MTPTEIAEMVLARQWETYVWIGVFLAVSAAMVYGIWRGYVRRPRRVFRERF